MITPQKSLEGKLALVTGASRGIGNGIARTLADHGCRIIGVARNSSTLEAAINGLPPVAGGHRTWVGDLLTEDGPKRLLEFCESEHLQPEILINNLGGSLAIRAWDDVDDWRRVWDLNVGIGHTLNAHLIPHMVDIGWGRVIHVSSPSARTFGGYEAYVSAKCALEGYVRSMGRNLNNTGVVLCAVAPGAIRVPERYIANLERDDPTAFDEWLRTETKAARLGSIDEVAQIVCFLASGAASYMSGSIVPIDGGT